MEIGAEISKNIKVSDTRTLNAKLLSGFVIMISLAEVMQRARLA